MHLVYRIFEAIAWYCETYNNLIPVAFVLGFYVSLVVGRWWDQFSSLPWPDNLALKVTAHLQGQDERARLMRRTIMRYMCLAFVITLHSISPPIKKRFPTFHHMTKAGEYDEVFIYNEFANQSYGVLLFVHFVSL